MQVDDLLIGGNGLAAFALFPQRRREAPPIGNARRENPLATGCSTTNWRKISSASAHFFSSISACARRVSAKNLTGSEGATSTGENGAGTAVAGTEETANVPSATHCLTVIDAPSDY